MIGKDRLDAFGIKLIVNHAGRQDLARSLGRALAVDDKEIFKRFAAVKLVCEVGKIYAKLHWLIMYCAVSPFAQQGRGRIGVGAVACIVDIGELKGLLGHRGRCVARDPCQDAYLRAVVVLHRHFHRALGRVAATVDIHIRCPVSLGLVRRDTRGGCHSLGDTAAHGVRAIDKSLVSPVAPRVGDNPCAVLVLAEAVVSLAHRAVAVQVELHAVVISDDGHGMVTPVQVPVHHVFLAGEAIAVIGGRGGNFTGLCAGDTHAYTHDATAVPVGRIIVVVVEIVLQGLLSFRRLHALRETYRPGDTVLHRIIKGGIALHPSPVAFVELRPAVDGTFVAPAIDVGRREAYIESHLVLARSMVGEGVLEHRCQLVLGQGSIGVVVRVHLRSHHVTNVRRDTTRPIAFLGEDGREVALLAVVPVVRQAGGRTPGAGRRFADGLLWVHIRAPVIARIRVAVW